MKAMGRFPAASFAAALAVNTGLCILIGTLMGGLRGARLGLVLGIALAILPVVARAVAAWLARPDNLLRFVARQIAATILRAARLLLVALERVFSPIAALFRGPVLLFRFVAYVLCGSITAALSAIGRTLATPLGLANLAALAVIAINIAGAEFATPIAILGLGLLTLALLVNESEARREDGPSLQGEDR